jgi:hypothetical protein
MRKSLAAAAVVAGTLGLPVLAALPASAATSGGQTYSATLSPVPLNGQTSASGNLMLMLNGNSATITENASGLASTFMGGPFPHVQHIHGGADGVCPTASADANHDGLITTTEGAPSYGPILTTLSKSGGTTPADGTNTKTSPSGSSFQYSRTIQLDSATVQAINGGTAVIVVHGLNPATAPKAATTEKSELVPSLPQAATAPAICGKLVASQMGSVPSGGAATGAGGTAGTQDVGLLAIGGMLLAGSGAYAARRFATR